ncbi:metallophosphoesterase [bacterium]|nr:metallophosphoesterase [bacterium]
MNRRQFLRAMAAGGVAAALPLSYGMGLHPSGIEVVRARINLPFLPPAFNGLKVALLSDLHYGAVGVTAGLVEAAFERTLQARPDVICLGGDLVTGRTSGLMRDVLAMLRGVSAPLGIFAALGNHEFRWGIESSAAAEFGKSPVHLLRNETVFLKRGGARLPLIGLDNFFNQPLDTLRRLLPELESRPCLVLEHSPDFAALLSPRFNGLVLAGHTHGGQVVLPGIGRMLSASRFGLRYVAGEYPAGGGRMYITRGIGAVLVPFRVGCPPEVSILELSTDRRMQVSLPSVIPAKAGIQSASRA